MNWTRFAAAFLFAPAVPALIFAAAALWMGAPLASAWSMFVLVSAVTYAHSIVLGLPVTWLLSRGSSLTWLRVVIAAFLIGALPVGGVTLYLESTTPPGAGYEANGVVLRHDGHLTSAGLQSAVLGVLKLGGLGALTGLVWRLIAVPKTRKLVA